MEAHASGSGGGPGRVRVHLRMGWCLLLLFISLGMALETLHAFKLGWYLDLANETRRLLLRLAHAHGVLLGLLNIAFALSLPHRAPRGERVEVWISRLVLVGSTLLPAGFLLGGLVVLGGDPNPAVLLAPVGAFLLFAGVLGVAWGFLAVAPPANDSASTENRRAR